MKIKQLKRFIYIHATPRAIRQQILLALTIGIFTGYSSLSFAAPQLRANNISQTSSTTPFVNGSSDQPINTLVTVVHNLSDLLMCQALTQANGNWQCQLIEALPQGTTSLQAIIIDARGDIGRYSFSVTVKFDSDNDGIIDLIEGSLDSDNDSLPNQLDLDSDNDGLPDSFESGAPSFTLSGLDVDKDSIDDAIDISYIGTSDSNGNGVADQFDPKDSDADGIADYIDPDSDNDGIPDRVEASNIPAMTGLDTDQDGIDNAIDFDIHGGKDRNNNNISDVFEPRKTDRDALPDYLDVDSDSDGILDSAEADATLQDSDGDGIDNLFDVDNAPNGVDSNLDGIRDDANIVDTDQDTIPDYRDLDSDNDGIVDVIEAGFSDDNNDGFVDGSGTTNSPQNSDNDDIPDFRDLDSNNDNLNDLATVGLFIRFDLNNDGRIDDNLLEDSDKDGIANIIDLQPQSFGLSFDTDKDGILDAQDLDDDNDGLADFFESPNDQDIDTDGDGFVDRVDLDSDDDGILDSLEGINGPLDDIDLNGRIDNFVDNNQDGIDDGVALDTKPVDSDSDGIPDFLDLDSDNDSLFDLHEASLEGPTLDSNNDGKIDSSEDNDFDGYKDVVDVDVNGSNFSATAIRPLNSNPSTAPDFQNPDSDDDGFNDGLENADYDKNGVIDRLQNDEPFQVGGGSYSFGLIGMLLGLAIYWRRSAISSLKPLTKKLKNHFFSIFYSTLLISALSIPSEQAHAINVCGRSAANSGDQGLVLKSKEGSLLEQDTYYQNIGNEYLAYDFYKCWYIGLGQGSSSLEPEGERVNHWEPISDSSDGYQVYLGYHITPHWFTEFSYTDAGSIEFSNTLPNANSENAELSYKIPALSFGYWLFDTNLPVNAYLKSGLSSIRTENTEDTLPVETSNIQINLGVGIQARWDRWFTRFYHDSYSNDVKFTGFSLGVYIGGKRQAVETPPVYDSYAPPVYVEPLESELNAKPVDHRKPHLRHSTESTEAHKK